MVSDSPSDTQKIPVNKIDVKVNYFFSAQTLGLHYAHRKRPTTYIVYYSQLNDEPNLNISDPNHFGIYSHKIWPV